MGNMVLIFVTIKIQKEWYISKYWIHTILLFYQEDFFSGLPFRHIRFFVEYKIWVHMYHVLIKT